jgi:hypothetical protein
MINEYVTGGPDIILMQVTELDMNGSLLSNICYMPAQALVV